VFDVFERVDGFVANNDVWFVYSTCIITGQDHYRSSLFRYLHWRRARWPHRVRPFRQHGASKALEISPVRACVSGEYKLHSTRRVRDRHVFLCVGGGSLLRPAPTRSPRARTASRLSSHARALALFRARSRPPPLLRALQVPQTVENFKCLATGERGVGKSGKPLHYKVPWSSTLF
jgi:hypothetical protein